MEGINGGALVLSFSQGQGIVCVFFFYYQLIGEIIYIMYESQSTNRTLHQLGENFRDNQTQQLNQKK